MSLPTQTKESNTLWYLAPILLSWLGGLIGYIYWRNQNKSFAQRLFVIGIALTVVYLIVLIAIGLSYNNTEDKIDVKQTEKIDIGNSIIETQITDLESKNNKLQNELSRLESHNDQLQFKLDNIQEKNEMTCDELYEVHVNEGFRTMTIDSIFEGGYAQLVTIMPDESKKPFANEILQLSNEGLRSLDEIKNNPRLHTCDFSYEQQAMVLFLDLYERVVGE